jgi:hypothetical protein
MRLAGWVFSAQVVQVVVDPFEVTQFVDDGQEVVQGAHGLQGRCVGWAQASPGHGESEGGLEEVEADALPMEPSSELTVSGSGADVVSGEFAVKREGALDESGGVGHHHLFLRRAAASCSLSRTL